MGTSSSSFASFLLVAIAIVFSNSATRAASNQHAPTTTLDPAFDCLAAISYEYCESAPRCAERYYMNHFQMSAYRRDVFNDLLGRHLLRTDLAASWVLARVLSDPGTAARIDALYPGANCSALLATTTSLERRRDTIVCANETEWWQILLGIASFCADSESFVAGIGCVCLPDKGCNEADPGEYAYTTRWFVIVAVVMLGAICWVLYWNMTQLRAVSKQVNETQTSVFTLSNMLSNKR